MENFNEIEVNGKKINLSELSEEELDKLEEYLKEERSILRKKVDEYLGLNPDDFNEE